MLTQRAVMTLRKHARVTSRAGRYKARIGATSVLIRDNYGEADIVTKKGNERPIRHRSISAALRAALHRGVVLVSPAGADGLQVAVGVARGMNLEPMMYAVAILLRERQAGDPIQGGEISSVQSDDIKFVETYLSGDITDAALMDWLVARGGKLAEVVALARR